MCGRFACPYDVQQIQTKLKESGVQTTLEFESQVPQTHRFNICPRQKIIVAYVNEKGDNVLNTMTWGFIPSWATKTPKVQPINVQDKTLLEKSTIFDKPKNQRRCIVIAEGFFEWKKHGTKKKTPYYIRRKDKQLMLMAGVYDISNISGVQFTCAIITTSAAPSLRSIHTRMPVILENSPEVVNTWLSGQPWGDKLASVMQPFKGTLQSYQVKNEMGSVGYDSPDCIAPVDQQKGSIARFLIPVQSSLGKRKCSPDPALDPNLSSFDSHPNKKQSRELLNKKKEDQFSDFYGK
ncbi:hypothetical protein J3Q64DRAFT_1713912 [Phycomyces blakesleeanus]|uniref:Embryonic stem cell-specific 5-hydroxymethylcytosine-binding protein n=1 Tax=Phycomyces blakesleeanus TaxID=4837 RepID=A0ABR3BFF4_PHYBL